MGRTTIIKDAQTNGKRSQKAPIVKDHILYATKGVKHTKNIHLDNIWCTVKNHMPPKVGSPQPQDKTFTFLAEQLIKFVAKVAIQVAQPHVLLRKPHQNATGKKSSLCRRVSEAAINQFSVHITGISLLDAISQLCPSVPSASKPKTSLAKGEAPFKFISSTKVIKPSAILKSLSHLAQLTILPFTAQMEIRTINYLKPLTTFPTMPCLSAISTLS